MTIKPETSGGGGIYPGYTEPVEPPVGGFTDQHTAAGGVIGLGGGECVDEFDRDIPAFTTYGRHAAWGEGPCGPWELVYTKGLNTLTGFMRLSNPPDAWIDSVNGGTIRGRSGAALLPLPDQDPWYSGYIVKSGVYLNPFADLWPGGYLSNGLDLDFSVSLPFPVETLAKVALYMPTLTGPGTNLRQGVSFDMNWVPTWNAASGTSVGISVTKSFSLPHVITVSLLHSNAMTQLSYEDDPAARTFWEDEIVAGGTYTLWIRGYHQPGESRMRVWKDGDPEPEAWATIETREVEGSNWRPRFFWVNQSSTAALNSPAPLFRLQYFELGIAGGVMIQGSGAYPMESVV